jgi:nucleoside-diphosphate-sugar epimerase
MVGADTRKLREEIGWKPQWSLQDGIAETINWWKTDARNG